MEKKTVTTSPLDREELPETEKETVSNSREPPTQRSQYQEALSMPRPEPLVPQAME